MSSINNKEKNFISAVVYLHNDGARAVEFCRAVAAELDSHFAQYELVVVDDACTDDLTDGQCIEFGSTKSTWFWDGFFYNVNRHGDSSFSF